MKNIMRLKDLLSNIHLHRNLAARAVVERDLCMLWDYTRAIEENVELLLSEIKKQKAENDKNRPS